MRLARYVHKAGHISFAPASVLLLTAVFALLPLADAGPRGLLTLARSVWVGAGTPFLWLVASPPPGDKQGTAASSGGAPQSPEGSSAAAERDAHPPSAAPLGAHGRSARRRAVGSSDDQ